MAVTVNYPPAPAASPAPMIETPVVFFNPEVLFDHPQAIQLGGEAVIGIRGAPALPNGTADRLTELCRGLAAPLVVTNTWGPIDMRDRLLGVGVRAHSPPVWITDQMAVDRATGIAAWLAVHGNPRCIVIDRPGVMVSGAVVVSIPLGAGLSAKACEAARAMLEGGRAAQPTQPK